MSLVLVESGPHSILVDHGRTHWRSLGVPLGGAADRTALAIGNALVGNSADTLALEFTLVGPTLRAEHSIAAAVFGAPFRIAVNNQLIVAGRTFTLQPDDMLRIGSSPVGVRGYLCVAGGFVAPEILGSRSSFESLRPGEILKCPRSRCEPRSLGFSSLHRCLFEPSSTSIQEFRVVPGPQCDWFDDGHLLAKVYEVSPASNRMGVRLKGEPMTRVKKELTSEAVAPGAVQITNDGLPVVLGVDGQTIGGYPKIAHVTRADLDHLGQLRPGNSVRFVPISRDQANIAAKDRAATVHSWVARLRAADRAPIIDSPFNP